MVRAGSHRLTLPRWGLLFLCLYDLYHFDLDPLFPPQVVSLMEWENYVPTSFPLTYVHGATFTLPFSSHTVLDNLLGLAENIGNPWTGGTPPLTNEGDFPCGDLFFFQ